MMNGSAYLCPFKYRYLRFHTLLLCLALLLSSPCYNRRRTRQNLTENLSFFYTSTLCHCEEREARRSNLIRALLLCLYFLQPNNSGRIIPGTQYLILIAVLAPKH